MESRSRSLLKAISWRITALIVTVSVVLAITGDTDKAVAVGVVDALIKITLYYLHERVWNRVSIGRGRPQIAGPEIQPV